MALRGVQRATIDLDFILMLEDLDRADAILVVAGYEKKFRSENVSHYRSKNCDFGRIDILHAFRGPTLNMLKRADRIEVADGLSLPVVQLEDIIGLKVQAAINDPKRHAGDWSDIRIIVESAAGQAIQLDWELLRSYLEIFDLTEQLSEIKEWYGKIDG